MARIPDEELERLKREVSLERLVASRGIALHRHGKDFLGLCPFHDDHEPSLVVSPDRNLWHCLGACRAGGSVIDWVMRAEGVSFRHAVELLRHDAISAPRRETSGKNGEPPKVSTVRRLPPPVTVDVADQELLDQVVAYYHATLKESPEALAYLESRDLVHPELVEHFRLGYANRTLGLRLPEKNRVAGAELRGRLQRLGVLRESGHEHFNGCLVVPIFDAESHVVELYGRKITKGLKPELSRHLYLPGPRRGVFHHEGLDGTREVILCEALLDALTFWSAGFRHVTSAYGIEGFTAEHLEAFKAHAIERVLIAYDRDEAGDRAAAALAKKLQTAGIAPFRLLFPKGMDANEYAAKVKPAQKSLGLVVRHAQWMGEGAAPALAMERAPSVLAEAAKERTSVITDDVVTDAAPTNSATPDLEIPSLATAEPVSGPTSPAPPSAATPASEASTKLPAPSPVAAGVPVEIRAEEVVLTVGDRRYRVRGMARNLSYEQLRVNLLVARGEAFHVDTLDLYSARQRATYVRQAAEELGLKDELLKKDLGQVLLKLEELQDEQIRRALEPQTPRVEMTEAERTQALELLEDPCLLDRVLEDFSRCGVVGEETNKLVGYLVAVSRKLDEPLAVILQSSTAAGKSSLLEAILAFLPEEERVSYSAMTGQSLFYMGEGDLRHKVLAVAEEEGAERASYALKLLQSEGRLTIASTGKDPHTGKLVTHEYRVEGPVAILLTTTAVEIDEELLNRCLVLTVDEDREQTRAIHRLQRERETLAGLLARNDRDQVLVLHRNAQRLLRPLPVVNPYARELTFLDARTRTRRDHRKYLALIRTIALLHQYQRPLKSAEHRGGTLTYVEVTLEDIALANRLAHEVLGRSLDELPPQTRRLLELLDRAVTRSCSEQGIKRRNFFFSRRWVREATSWTDFQVRTHLGKLVALEYALVHRGGRGQSFVYELLYDGQTHDERPHLAGLLDVEKLRDRAAGAPTTTTSRGEKGDYKGSSSPQRAPIEPGSWSAPIAAQPNNGRRLILFAEDEDETALLDTTTAASVVAVESRSRIELPSSLAASSLAAPPNGR